MQIGTRLALVAGMVMYFASSANAEQIRVTIENLQPNDGFFFTPVWLGFHDGSFDLFDTGSGSSSELETIAETGDAAPLRGLFSSATNGNGTSRFDETVFGNAGFPGAPVFDPGETVSIVIDVPDSVSNRYLSVASMVIPSNDAFFGNDDPMQNVVFNADGSFAGPLTINILGSSIYDTGTEVNDPTGGAAFSALGGNSVAEGGIVNLHAGLDDFVGTDIAPGGTLGSPILTDELVARIHITAVPEASTGILAAIGLLTLAVRCFWRRIC